MGSQFVVNIQCTMYILFGGYLINVIDMRFCTELQENKKVKQLKQCNNGFGIWGRMFVFVCGGELDGRRRRGRGGVFVSIQ